MTDPRVLVSTVLCSIVSAQGTVYTLNGGERFGAVVSGIGDVNGDTKEDFVVGAPLDRALAGVESGSVTAYSGANGMLLYVVQGIAPYDHLGVAVCGASDVNDDGVPDIAVGTGENPLVTSPVSGRLVVLSGLDGTVLHQVQAPTGSSSFAFSVAAAGDFDIDGFHDIAVGDPAAQSVTFVSGRNGTVSLQVISAEASFGHAVENVALLT